MRKIPTIDYKEDRLFILIENKENKEYIDDWRDRWTDYDILNVFNFALEIALSNPDCFNDDDE